MQLFEQAGMDCSQLREKGRKLILPVGDGSLQAVLAKAADVITYVEHGVCDMGVVGKDTIMENGSHFFEDVRPGLWKVRLCPGRPQGLRFFTGATGPRPSPPNTPTWPGVFSRANRWTCASSK